MRHLLKSSIALLIILMFSGCEKEPDLNLKQLEEESFSAPFHGEITDTYLALFQLISTGMKEAITKPQLYFLAEVGDTRDCPNSSIVDNGGATYSKTLTLDFDEGGAGFCNSAGINYSGMVDIDFNAPLGSDADPVTDPEIVVGAVSGITINGYEFELESGIELQKNSSSTADFFSYDFLLLGDITSTKNGTTTTLPAGSCGTFSTGFNDGDDVNNPASFVNNPFDVSLKQTDVHCTGSNGVAHTFCTMTGDEPLSLDPSNCSCPKDGDLEIVAGTCGSTGGAISAYDFGSDANSSDRGACDVFVEEVSIIDFLSWETVIMANGGPLDGMTSENIGVSEPGPLGTSLQLTDTGSGIAGHGFMWTSPTTASSGMINTNQTISNTTTPSTPWINEIHYDNDGPDTNEGIEIAGPAGLDLSNYCLLNYNDDGTFGSEISLRGMSIRDEGNGYGAVFIDIRALQNGDQGGGGIAFYRKDNVAVNFCAGR